MYDFQQSFREYYTYKFGFPFLLKLLILKNEGYITRQFLSLRFEYDIIGLLNIDW